MGRSRRTPAPGAALLVVCGAVVLAGCTDAAPTVPPPGDGAPGPPPISVRATDTVCDLSASQAPAGTLTFTVTNTGRAVTAFSVHGAGDRVLGAVENIGPGLTRQLVVDVPDTGVYTTVCTPGTAADGIRAPFTVTSAAPRTTDPRAALAEATAAYKRYLTAQVEALVPATQEFAAAVKARDVDRAKAVYPTARAGYERIEPVVQLFGALDQRIDGRVDDPRDPGVAWTGFHRLEKDLWVDGLRPDSPAVADQLVADVTQLRTRVATVQLPPDRVATGAKELLDEVLNAKIPGTEDRYSHTDLWDLAANVQGSQAVVAALRPVIDAKDPTLGPVLDQRFAAVEALLATYRVGAGFTIYTALTRDDAKKMTDAIDALSEPVSRVAGVITS